MADELEFKKEAVVRGKLHVLATYVQFTARLMVSILRHHVPFIRELSMISVERNI